MAGGIYSDERCPICGNTYQDNFRSALVCPRHPKQKAGSFKVIFKGLTKRFKSYDAAFRCLTGWRFESDENKFDERAYRKNSPLSFERIAVEWLQVKKRQNIQPNTYRALEEHINKAVRVWGNRNILTIRLKDFDHFLSQFDVSPKSKANYIQTMRQLWGWLYDNEEIKKLPKFPKVRYELRRKPTVDKNAQYAVLDKLRQLTTASNLDTETAFRCWLGIRWMTVYINVRPAEIRDITENDIDLIRGEILIPHPKEGKAKKMYLLDEDVEHIRSLPRGMPHLHFFRHKNGDQVGEKFFYKWWIKACKALGIEGVDLYRGTRHSSCQALRGRYSPEEIRLASMHTTDKSFERYYQQEGDDYRRVYSGVADKALTRISGRS